MKNRIKDSLFCLLIGTLYAYALSGACLASTILEFPQAQLLLVCLVSVLFLSFVFFNKYTFLAAAAGALLFGLFLYLSLRKQQFEAEWYLELRAYIRQLVLFSQGLIPYQVRFSRTLGTFIAVLMSLLTVLNIRVHFNFLVLAVLGLGVISVPIYLDWGTSDAATTLLIFCVLVLLIKRLNLFANPRRQGGRGVNQTVALAAIPFCLLVTGAAYLLPKPEAALNQNAQQYITDAADNLLYGAGTGQIMSFSNNGGRLGGAISQNDKFVMEVQSDERVYLSGSIWDTYTGSSWTKSIDEHTVLATDANGWYPASGYSGKLQSLQDYYMRYYGRSKRTLTVYIQENRTKMVFSPPYLTHIWLSDEEARVSRDDFGVVSANRPLNRYASYTQDYISWDYNNIYLASVLRSTAYHPENGESLERMEAYLQLPVGLPQRVYDLAGQLTEGLNNDYDKVRALESYLAASFPYTLEPVAVPYGEDFIDYFLFTGKEGYCVYYASSLAVMARCLGIPTRYVEGFAMPRQQNENGAFTITNAQAHAWTEVYFYGFGWIPFEPTAASYEGFYAEQAPVTPEPPEATANPEEEVIENPNLDPNPEPDIEEPNGETGENPVGGRQEQEDAKPSAPFLPELLLAVAALVLALVLSAIGMVELHKAKFRRIDGLSNRQGVTAYYEYALKAAKALGYPMLDNETAHAFAERIGKRIVLDSHVVSMEELADIFSNAAYSENEVTVQDLARVRESYRELLRMLQTRMNKPKFFINSYILIRF